MIDIRPFAGLGHVQHGWLDTRHHFSFASYLDRARMGWGAIRVWNDDTIAAHTGFDPHPHKDMEIVTFVRQGAVTHEDSLGNKGRTGAGDMQVMSAGTGIVHAEYNREDEATTLFQIWILPDRSGEKPGWGQRDFPRGDRSGSWVTMASGLPQTDGETDALPIRANARILAATLTAGQRVSHTFDPARHQYLVAPTGRIHINGMAVQPRDGVAITGETTIEVAAIENAEVVLVDAV